MTGSSNETSNEGTLTIGALTLTLSQLKLGQMKAVRAELNLLLGLRKLPEELPSIEHIEAMTTLIFVSAKVSDPSLTREQVASALDELPFDEGMLILAQGTTKVMTRSGIKKPLEGIGAGEASSPAETSSTSSGSTG